MSNDYPFLYDMREPPNIRNALQGLGATADTLETGDILLGHYLIERKEVNDFFASLYDGRLYEQAARLTQQERRYLIVLEGSLKDALIYSRGNTFHKLNSYYGTVAKLMGMGVAIVPVLDDKGTINLVRALKKYAAEPLTEIPEHIVKVRSVNDYEAALMQVDGIGERRAHEVAEQVPTMALLCTQSFLQLIDLCGEKTAENLWKMLHGSKPPVVFDAMGTGVTAQRLVREFPGLAKGEGVHREDVLALDGFGPGAVEKLAAVGLIL